MIDGHVHLERGSYTKEWFTRFVEQAKRMEVTKLKIVEHTHRFKEFEEVYESIFKDTLLAKEQKEWFYKAPKLELREYTEFINEMKQYTWGIEIDYGLEVCYFREKEELLRKLLGTYEWDFLIGSIHWIEGWGFDNAKTKWSWEYKNINEVYGGYYREMGELIQSGLFDTLAHPDSIKCFGYYPTKSITMLYQAIARLLKESKMKTEFSSGLHINYGHEELGVNREFLKILLEEEVEIITVSDAHRPEDVGRDIRKGLEIIAAYQENKCIPE